MNAPTPPRHSLDPEDWDGLRAQAHRMLDDLFAHLQGLRGGPAWRPIPPALREAWREPLPRAPGDLAAAHQRFMHEVLPHGAGNTHPRFMGWVQGAGTVEGMLAEMLAAGLNANCGGRDHMAIEVERQVVHWMRELFRFPSEAQGLFVTGSSMANLLALLVARTRALGTGSRQGGLGAAGARLMAYTSVDAHRCIAQAMEIAGLGTSALRRVPVNAQHQMDVQALAAMIDADRRAGLVPFFVAATAGTVDVGAIDPLPQVAALAEREGLWCHVDGALGALGMLSPEIAPRLAGIEQADSIALDFHKWGQVPYDAGFLLVRDGQAQLDTFSTPAAYLSRAARGLAAGSIWPCDLGPDLSRGFRAWKTWFTFMVHGGDALGASMAGACAVAQHLAARVSAEPALELMAPVALNIVCFRHRGTGADALNAEIVQDLHESGIAVPSMTTLNGRIAIRAAIVNHRTTAADADALVDAVLACGRARGADAAARPDTLPPDALRDPPPAL
jgi:glutamate/tyrosine decarboxylase-like PLP-dependent enzyme